MGMMWNVKFHPLCLTVDRLEGSETQVQRLLDTLCGKVNES